MKKIAIILTVIIILSAAVYYALPVPEPEHCSLCDRLPCHAPCIVNLSTGELVELAIYDPHPYKVGEIADEQRSGYFCLIHSAGAEGYMNGGKYVEVTIPMRSDSMNEKYFCNSCRDLLDSFRNCGYILADLKDVDAPVIYPIETGTSFSLRCYEVEIDKNEEDGKYELMVCGIFEK